MLQFLFPSSSSFHHPVDWVCHRPPSVHVLLPPSIYWTVRLSLFPIFKFLQIYWLNQWMNEWTVCPSACLPVVSFPGGRVDQRHPVREGRWTKCSARGSGVAREIRCRGLQCLWGLNGTACTQDSRWNGSSRFSGLLRIFRGLRNAIRRESCKEEGRGRGRFQGKTES